MEQTTLAVVAVSGIVKHARRTTLDTLYAPVAVQPMPENAALVAALIVERPMCLDCIAQRALLSLDGAQIVLDTINRTVPVQRRESARCQTCGVLREVYFLPRP